MSNESLTKKAVAVLDDLLALSDAELRKRLGDHTEGDLGSFVVESGILNLNDRLSDAFYEADEVQRSVPVLETYLGAGTSYALVAPKFITSAETPLLYSHIGSQFLTSSILLSNTSLVLSAPANLETVSGWFTYDLNVPFWKVDTPLVSSDEYNSEIQAFRETYSVDKSDVEISISEQDDEWLKAS